MLAVDDPVLLLEIGAFKNTWQLGVILKIHDSTNRVPRRATV